MTWPFGGALITCAVNVSPGSESFVSTLVAPPTSMLVDPFGATRIASFIATGALSGGLLLIEIVTMPAVHAKMVSQASYSAVSVVAC